MGQSFGWICNPILGLVREYLYKGAHMGLTWAPALIGVSEMLGAVQGSAALGKKLYIQCPSVS